MDNGQFVLSIPWRWKAPLSGRAHLGKCVGSCDPFNANRRQHATNRLYPSTAILKLKSAKGLREEFAFHAGS
jgi:hypothetical protein